MKSMLFLLPLILLVSADLIHSQSTVSEQSPPYPPTMPGTIAKVYKTIGATELQLYIFQPPDRTPSDRYPAIVFFFGGGWQLGSVQQFLEQSKYFASRGMVAILADYRVKSRHGVTPLECMADAKSAIRWVRAHAIEFGVDPDRIVAAGGSAGGHLAACAALVLQFDEPTEDGKINSAPNALILFNPVLDVSQGGRDRGFGEHALGASPLQHVRPGLPPTIIFHGTADTLVAFSQAVQFTDAMRKQGNRCDLLPFEGRHHGFFNYGRGDGQDYIATVRAADEFLVSLGYLRGKPTIR